MEALGIAPSNNVNEVRTESTFPKVSIEPEHGWRVVPRLTMRYIPIKKNTEMETTAPPTETEPEVKDHHLNKTVSDNVTDGSEKTEDVQVTGAESKLSSMVEENNEVA